MGEPSGNGEVSPGATQFPGRIGWILVERLDHGVLHAGVDIARALALAEAEHTLDNAELGGGGVETSDGEPIVDNHSSADNVGTTVDTTGDKGNL
ncbi:hypothetical protein HG530_014114 [Fusarium avenaceum]|nr:hypothetical protein HG530_014114 [Fusarium avenaceum]